MSSLLLVRMETVLVSVQNRCTVCTKLTRLGNHFGQNRWYSKVTKLKCKLVPVYLEIVLILMQAA
jgi:hypothetical protein